MKKLITISLILLAVVVSIGYWITIKPNFITNEDGEKRYLYIREQQTLSSIVDEISQKGYCKNNISLHIISFIYGKNRIAQKGAYLITDEMNNIQFINKIVKGRQNPVLLRVNNIRKVEQLAKSVSHQTTIDSVELCKLLVDETILSEYGLNASNALTMFIPNTYEVYWTISNRDFLNRMKREYDVFWNEKRVKAAKEIPLTQIEVSILASIVEEETNDKEEMKMVAGLYINRLKKGMKLQADPTARYALGDFDVDRILLKHTQLNNKYNTYIFAGLPPGPIRIPSIKAIDAVLNYKKHNYIFMCAKPQLNGKHNFAESYKQHIVYARQYYKAFEDWKNGKESKKK